MSNELRTPQDDDGFHEIQLNGKQLVFLGMATTLVSVVIFLCGVLVGRGVRPLEPVAEAAAANLTAGAPAVPDGSEPMAIQDEPEPAGESRPADEAQAPTDVPEPVPPAPDPAPAPKEQAPAPSPEPAPAPNEEPRAAGEPTPSEPAPAAREAKREEPKARRREPEPPPVVAEAPAPAPTPEPARSAPRSGGKVAVQVAALSNRADAEAVARRLSGKGYAVYVVSPEPGTKAIYKVRVGDYASMDEAQRISARLAQEEKLKPWIIR